MSKNRESKNLIVGLDIGTSKIACIVAEIRPEGTLEVIGAGMHHSSGMKKCMVVNIDATVAAIQRALEEAELMADCKIRDVYTGIAGGHIKSSNANGMIKIKDKEVAHTDIMRAVETASSISLPGDQQILHILEQESSIDGQEGIKKPLGMSGMRLEVQIHIVTGAVSALQNILKCVHRCGLEVNEMILQPLASSKAVLADDEKELGVCLVDIGGGTTDVAIFTNGAIRHTAVIPIPGDQITNDIAMALRTPTKDAEDIKIKYGLAERLGQALQQGDALYLTEALWRAYTQLEVDRARGAGERRVLADLVSLVRHAALADELVPYPERVAQRYQEWLAGRPEFTPQQRWWLDEIARHIGVNVSDQVADLNAYAFQARGGQVAAARLFGVGLPGLLDELNASLSE